jgi:hypothetical protein
MLTKLVLILSSGVRKTQSIITGSPKRPERIEWHVYSFNNMHSPCTEPLVFSDSHCFGLGFVP